MDGPANRIAELRRQLEHHNRLYYTDARPEITDADYDRLFRELEELERQHPELDDPNSPTRRVGGEPIEGFRQVRHLLPMLSIDDVFEWRDLVCKRVSSEIHQLEADLRAAKSSTERRQLIDTVPKEVRSEFETCWRVRQIEDIDPSRADLELVDFYLRLRKAIGTQTVPVSVEPKIDGVAVSVVYRHGHLEYVATRGDGETGDDITTNARTIRNLPLLIQSNLSDAPDDLLAAADQTPQLLEVRGEVFMPNAAFAAMNEDLDEAGLPTFANPRNATAGTLKQLDPKIVARRPLRFLAHGLGAYEGPPITNEKDFQVLLDRSGIPRNQPVLRADNLDTLLGKLAEIDRLRHKLDFGTDGAVIKLLDRSAREQLGNTSRAPRWAAAYKFLPEQKETVLLDITVQVGRTGILTPVAELEPVLVSGTTVSRATLHNQTYISDKDIRIGDDVLVHKAGEIIPEIINVISSRPSKAKEFSLLTHLNHRCPACGGPIEERSTETGPKSNPRTIITHFCLNFECSAQAVTRLTHFASRKALDLEGLDEAVASKLVDQGLIQTPLDLFRITISDLANLLLDAASLSTGKKSKERRFGEDRAHRLLTSIKAAATEKPMSKWLVALGISQIGETTAREVTRLFRSMRDLPDSQLLRDIAERGIAKNWKKDHPIQPKFENIPEEERERRKLRFTELNPRIKELDELLRPYELSPELGGIAAKNLLDFFSSAAGGAFLSHLQELNIDPTSDNFNPSPASADASSSPIAGKIFVLTGTLSVERSKMKILLETHGAKVTGSISARTDFLLAGSGGGSKRSKASDLGVRILSEDELNQLLAE